MKDIPLFVFVLFAFVFLPLAPASQQARSNDQPPSGVSVSVLPHSAPVTSKVSEQFTAVVKGTSNQIVTWYVDGHLGGNTQVGTIDDNGLYTPPVTFVVGTHIVKAVSQADKTKSARSSVYLVGFQGMYTNRYDNSRTGQNLQETVLTDSNVNVRTFGKLFSYPIDWGVEAQPLYVANVNIPNPLNGTAGYHNVVYVATDHDSVFAFDADGKASGPLWKVSFINPPSVIPVPGACFPGVFNSEIGVQATPVIDPATNTLYLDARTLENPTSQCVGTYVHRLHALDVATGEEKFGGPVVIQASVPGTGSGSKNGILSFDPQFQNVRPGLLLSKTSQDTNNIVFFGSASLGDDGPYHGWVLGYDSQTLAQKYVFCTTPNGDEGGIWQMGGGLAADASGNVFATTGNGRVDDKTEYALSVLKLTPSNGVLTLGDYFTPANWRTLDSHDWDVSSGGVLLLPDQPGNHPHLLVAGGKEGTIYLIDRDDMGEYNANGDQIVQEIVGAIRASTAGGGNYGIWNTSSYFQNNVYIFGHFDYPKMFKLQNGLLPTTATSAGTVMMKSPNPVFSANGSNNGIVWILQYDARILWAFDPNDLTHEFYDTNLKKNRDKPPGGFYTVTPTVANGRVYVATRTELVAYGLF